MKTTQRGPKLAAQLVLTCLMLFSPSIVLSTRLENTPLPSKPATYPFYERSTRPTCYLKVQSYNGGAGPVEDDVIDSLSGDLYIKHTDFDSYHKNCPDAGDCHTIFISFSDGWADVVVRCGTTKTKPVTLPCPQRTPGDAVFCKTENTKRAIALVRLHLDHDSVEHATGRR